MTNLTKTKANSEQMDIQDTMTMDFKNMYSRSETYMYTCQCVNFGTFGWIVLVIKSDSIC